MVVPAGGKIGDLARRRFDPRRPFLIGKATSALALAT
jgi:hypothetical protein